MPFRWSPLNGNQHYFGYIISIGAAAPRSMLRYGGGGMLESNKSSQYLGQSRQAILNNETVVGLPDRGSYNH